MKWIEVKVIFDHPEPETGADLVADIFYDMSLSGVIIDGLLPEPLDAWAEDIKRPSPENAVRGFFPKDDRLEWRLADIRDALHRLEALAGLSSTLSLRELDEEDWAESWKAHFHPERVGSRIVVKPTWRTYDPLPGELVIEIDPGMAFGTGTHPTTMLCVRMIETYLRPGDRFLDVGTGSGILMVTAHRLGASRLSGVDSDPLAVEVAGRNLRLNHVPADAWEVIEGDLSAPLTRRFDLIAANILTDVVIRLLPDLPRLMTGPGRVILSGIVAENRDRVIRAMAEQGLKAMDVRESEGWVAIAGERAGSPVPSLDRGNPALAE